MAADLIIDSQVALRFSRQFMPPREKTCHDCVILGDTAVFRVRMVKFLKKIPFLRVLTEGARARYIPAKLDRIVPDLAIVNIQIAGANPLATIRILKDWYPKLLILVISDYTNPILVKRILMTGANGYLCSTNPEEQLEKAAKSLLAGKLYIDSGLIAPLLDNLYKHYQSPESCYNSIEYFSDKEFNIFILLGKGLSCQDIAVRTGFSLSAIRYCIRNLRAQLNLAKTADVKKYAEDWVHKVL